MTFWQRVYTSVHRRVWVLSKDLLLDEEDNPANTQEFHMRFLTTDSLEAYEAFRPGGRVSASRRLNAGHRAILVCDSERIVGCVWAATGRAYVPYLDRDIVLGPHEVYTFDAYTHPDFRRRGVSKIRNLFLIPEYRRMGYDRAAAIVAFENRPGIRSAEAAGYRQVGVFGCVRLGFTQIDLPCGTVGGKRFARPLTRGGG